MKKRASEVALDETFVLGVRCFFLFLFQVNSGFAGVPCLAPSECLVAETQPLMFHPQLKGLFKCRVEFISGNENS